MLDPLSLPFFQKALLAGFLASIACGIMGSYVVVRGMASISGGLGHAAFGGVGLGYLLGWNPMVGATGFSVLSGLGIGWAYRRWRSSLDTLIAMLWSLGMALGILFISLTPGYAPDLMSYLFGSILFVPQVFLWLTAALDLLLLVVVPLFFKELQAVSLDEDFAKVMGLPVGLFFYAQMLLTALVVVLLIRVVGVILVIALLTIPATVARQWTARLGTMMAGASFLGALCTCGGLFLSYWLSEWFEARLPTGPVIILLTGLLYVTSSIISLLLSRSKA